MTNPESDLLKTARDVLKGILETIPAVTLNWDIYQHSDRKDLVPMIDFTVGVQNSALGREDRLAIEVKSRGHPRDLREGINSLFRFQHRAKQSDNLVIAAPFITAEGAALCEEEKVGYFDFAGNCRLQFGGYFIERVGRPNRFRQAASTTPDLFAPKSERVLRVLFQERHPWKVQPLAEKADVSVGTVSTVRTLLLQREWARDADTGIQLTQPQRLLKEWAVVWARRRENVQTYFTMLSLAEAELKLAEFAHSRQRPFALTGAAGAWRRAPMTRYHRMRAYWDGDPAELAQAIGMKAADTGGNVQILAPRDEGVFFARQEIDGVSVVSDLQIYLDLKRDPSRGEEAAEHLWSTILFPDGRQ